MKRKKPTAQKVINLELDKCLICNSEPSWRRIIDTKGGCVVVSVCGDCNWKSNYEILDVIYNNANEMLCEKE